MIYILIAVIILIMIVTFENANKLGQILFSINKIGDKLSDLTVQISEAVTKNKNDEDEEKENINKKAIEKAIEKLSIDKSPNNYMAELYGYIEQTKMFTTSQILFEIQNLPFKNINDYVKQHYLMMFALMMEENNLCLDDFKIDYTYGGDGSQKHYYIEFELKDTKYFGWDEWISKGILVAEMANGDIKEFEVVSYANELEEFFDTESEYETINFFDALTKTYNSFSFDKESYHGYSRDNHIIILNDLIQQYNNVGKKWNVIFAKSTSLVYDYAWAGKLEDLFIKTNIIDTSWAIDEFQEVQILDSPTIEDEREKIFNSLSESLNDDERFKLATMYYYRQFYTYWNSEKHSNQKEAVKIWKELAEKDHAYSQLVMGILYFDGMYLLKNFSKSKNYIELAFDNGLVLPAKKVWEDLKLYNY